MRLDVSSAGHGTGEWPDMVMGTCVKEFRVS